MDEYHSIMKNDVWEIVPRPEGKLVVTARWLYKLKHAVDGSVEKYKAMFVVRGFHRLRVLIMMILLCQLLNTLLSGL